MTQITKPLPRLKHLSSSFSWMSHAFLASLMLPFSDVIFSSIPDQRSGQKSKEHSPVPTPQTHIQRAELFLNARSGTIPMSLLHVCICVYVYVKMCVRMHAGMHVHVYVCRSLFLLISIRDLLESSLQVKSLARGKLQVSNHHPPSRTYFGMGAGTGTHRKVSILAAW